MKFKLKKQLGNLAPGIYEWDEITCAKVEEYGYGVALKKKEKPEGENKAEKMHKKKTKKDGSCNDADCPPDGGGEPD